MTKKKPMWASKLVSEKIMYEKLKNEIKDRGERFCSHCCPAPQCNTLTKL